MFPKVTLRSAWYHKRLLAVTLLAAWLVAGFSALLPLFLRTLSEAVATDVFAGLRPEMGVITLVNPRPFAPDTLAVVDRELGGLTTTRVTFSRAIGGADAPYLGKICGYDYTPGEAFSVRTRFAASSSDHCYALYSFATLSELFRLADGRWPDALDAEPPAPPFEMGEPQLEAVLTGASAQAAGLTIGDRLAVGNRPEQVLVVEIVGLIEPVLPADDVLWHGHTIVQKGEWTPLGDDARFDVGLIIPSAAFDQWILPRYQPNAFYYWWLRADTNAIDSTDLDSLGASLYRVQRDLRASNPELELVSGLKSVAEEYTAENRRLSRLVWSLAGPALLLMAFEFLTIARVALQGVHDEMAALRNRGASVYQQVALRAGLIGVAGVTSVVVGPLLARAATAALLHVGPLAAVPGLKLPPLLKGLAGAAAGAAGVCVLLAGAAGYGAGFALARSQPSTPSKPLWRRFFLDLLLVAAGLALVARLYFSATGDLRQSVEALWSFPSALAGTGDTGAVELLDPVGMLGVVLVLTGLALLWLRVWPAAVRLAKLALRRRRGLTIPWAAWHTGRDLDYYAPLLVMLTATLALGVASLTLESTHNRRASRVAQRESGADVRLAVDRAGGSWESLPDVRDSTTVIRLAASAQTVLMGVDPNRSFGGLEGVAALLAGQRSDLPGVELPADSVAIQLQVETPQEGETTTTTRLDVLLLNARGERYSRELAPAEPGVAGRFVIYSAALPDQPRPWRVLGFRLHSERDRTTMFSHRIYLDDLAVVSTAGAETVLEDFAQADGAAQWASASSQSSTATVAAWDAEHGASSPGSLSVDYRIRYAAVGALQPLLMVHEVAFPQLPVVVSEAFADAWQRQSGTGRALAVGDSGQVQLDLAGRRFRMSYRVVGIVGEFPSIEPSDRLLVAPLNDLRLALNAQSGSGPYYDANQAWLTLDSAQPSSAFRQAAAELPGVGNVTYAWDRYATLKREPAANAVTGTLFAAFGFAWALYALFSATFVLGRNSQKDESLRTLQVLGFENRRLRRLHVAEQLFALVPTLAFGVLVSVLLVRLLLPFLMQTAGDGLYFSRETLMIILALVLGSVLPVVSLRFAKKDGLPPR